MRTKQPIKERAKDAVARALLKRLHVPTVFFNARWPSATGRVDLLVLDRAGAGDVHVVQIALDSAAAAKAVRRVMQVPAQFRWVAFVFDRPESELDTWVAEYDRWKKAPLFPTEGMGRVGIVLLRWDSDEDDKVLEGEILVPAERFPGSYYDEADQFAASHRPDIMFR